MNKYKIGHGLGVHTCRITLMEREFIGHITFELGGNCRGASIINSALEYLYDPCKLESDCGFTYTEDGYYSFSLRNGESILPIDGIDFDELSDMIVAVEIIDYKDEEKRESKWATPNNDRWIPQLCGSSSA